MKIYYFHLWQVILSAFERLRKAIISFVVFACLSFSVRMEQLGYDLKDFHEIWYFEYLSKIFWETTNFTKNHARTVRTLHAHLCKFAIISPRRLLRIGNISDSVVEKIRTHILCQQLRIGNSVMCHFCMQWAIRLRYVIDRWRQSRGYWTCLWKKQIITLQI